MTKSAFILGLMLLFVPGVNAQLNMTFLGNYPYVPELSDIWGHVDSLDNEYAIVGVENGVSIVDVTVPSNPSEVYFISGPNTIWRDIKVWNNHAYITNESSGGLKIIDLSNLPNPSAPTVTTFTGSSFPFTKAHDLFIDENGVAYIMGANYGAGGAIMLDLTVDPMNPVELGVFNTYYLHDGMVRGDTLWGGAINNGFFVVVDVSNKLAPVVLATQNTPSNFTHNCWISDDGNTLFTTDEKSNAFVTSYDVSNLSNITELDRIQSNPGTSTIVHNTFFMNNFLITSYYRDGVTVHDVTRPANMIETGNYDTYSAGAGSGFNGAWGVYPWLPSGNIIVSDIENGLFILGPNYTRGCYLEGTVTDFNTSNPINNATIEILSGVATTSSDIVGDYAISTLSSGTYNVVFSAVGYTADTVIAILSNGVLTILDVQLVAPIPLVLSGQVVEANGGNPIANANVLITNNTYQWSRTTDGLGNFSVDTFFVGTYEVVAGKWLHKTICGNMFLDSNSSPLVIALDSGIYDDFTFDFGWAISGTAATGVWVRGEPDGTDYVGVGDANPGVDVGTDCQGLAYVTGNGGGSAGNDDVDDGNTILKSPLFDLTAYTEPYIKYHRWFFNDGGSGTPNDTLSVRISNGSVSVILEEVTENSSGNSSWISKTYKVSDYLSPTSMMQLTIETSDFSGSGHLVEAGIDLFQVEDFSVSIAFFNATCNSVCDAGAVAQALGGVSPLTYLWDDPTAQTTDTASGLCAGLFTAIVIDALGDTATSQVTITQPIAISLSTSSAALCDASLSNVTVVASNGTAPYTYAWSDGNSQTTQTATSLSIGTYTVIVTDGDGCSNSTSVTTTVNSVMSAAASGANPLSCGGNNGTATASVSNGNSPFTFAWDDGLAQVTQSAVGLSSGVYIVTVTDASGCSDTGVAVLSDPGAPSLTISSTSMPACFGLLDGVIAVSISGAAGPFTYAWSTAPTQTDSIATGLAAGTYSVSVTAGGGICTASISATISEPLPPVVLVTGSDIMCFGGQNGMAIASASGGTLPYNYLWSTGQNTALLDSLSPGVYSVFFTDGNSCVSNTESVTISEPSPITISNVVTDVVCNGDSNGAIILAVSGGVLPLTYDWSDGSTTKDISNLGAGTYLLVLTDNNACSIIENIAVGTQSAGAQTSSILGPVVVNQTANESYAVTLHAGSGYVWSVIGGTQVGGGPGNSILIQWNILGSGQVSVVETDSLGCIGDTVFLNVSIVTSVMTRENDPMQVVIYPNPSSGLFTVTLKSVLSPKVIINVYDARGAMIKTEKWNYTGGWYQGDLNLEAFGEGLYFINFESERGIVSRKVVVQ